MSTTAAENGVRNSAHRTSALTTPSGQLPEYVVRHRSVFEDNFWTFPSESGQVESWSANLSNWEPSLRDTVPLVSCDL